MSDKNDTSINQYIQSEIDYSNPKIETKINKEDEIIRSVEITNTYTDKREKYDTIFYYRIDDKADLGKGIYAKISLNHGNEIDFDNWDKINKAQMHEEQGIKLEYIYSVTEKEYFEAFEK